MDGEIRKEERTQSRELLSKKRKKKELMNPLRERSGGKLFEKKNIF